VVRARFLTQIQATRRRRRVAAKASPVPLDISRTLLETRPPARFRPVRMPTRQARRTSPGRPLATSLVLAALRLLAARADDKCLGRLKR
jgi:hypothetical protein